MANTQTAAPPPVAYREPFDPGPEPKLTWLPVDLLKVDPSYQRTMDSRRSKLTIGSIAANFHWSCFGVIMVAKGEGRDYWIMDGQHRVAGARSAGIELVPCLVVEAASAEQQARIFIAVNTVRTPVQPYAVFHGRLKARDPAAVATAELCAQAQLEIPRYPIQRKDLKPGQVMCFSTIEAIAADPTRRAGRDAVLAVGLGFAGRSGGATPITIKAAEIVLQEIPTVADRIQAWFARKDPNALALKYAGTAGTLALADQIRADIRRQAASDAAGDFIKAPSPAQRMGAR